MPWTEVRGNPKHPTNSHGPKSQDGEKKTSRKNSRLLYSVSKPRDPQVAASGIENTPACTSNAASKRGGGEAAM